MNQRGLTIMATYLNERRLGRIIGVRNVGEDDYIVAIEDIRDGRTHLVHSAGDLRRWLDSFRAGECLRPAAAICGRCKKLHVDRDVDAELLVNCIPCCGELIAVAAEALLEEGS